MKQDLKGLGTYGTVGLEFALSILFGLFVGRWIDGKLSTTPWFALVGIALGLAAGIKTLLRALKSAQRELAEEDQREREAKRRYFERPPDEMRSARDEKDKPE